MRGRYTLVGIRRYTLVGIRKDTLVVYPPRYTLVVYLPIYTMVYPPIHPGYTTMVYMHLSGMYTCSVLGAVPDDEALGSTLGLIRDMRHREPPSLPKV